MPLERLKEVPQFHHGIDDYELGKMTPTDAYIARKNAELHKAIDWNNRQTLLLNHLAVDQRDQIEKLEKEVHLLKLQLEKWQVQLDNLKATLRRPLTIALAILTLIAPAIISRLLDHFLGP